MDQTQEYHHPQQQQLPQDQMPIQQHPPPPSQHQPSHHAASAAAPHPDRDPRKWRFGLFDCFGDVGGSLMACFLPCILHGRTMDRIKDPSLQSHDPFNMECMLWCGIQCFTGCLVSNQPNNPSYNIIKRADIRKQYGIHGSGSSDCCISYCCLCCALVQQDREVALRAGHPVGPITQGYQAEKQGMQMPAPNPPAQQAQPPPPQQQGLSQQSEPLVQTQVGVQEQQVPPYLHEGQHQQKQQ
ncbi:hypothetical protein E4U55_004653 [Claviceps digitariae]|nr:hypothetical protein E4U55_004653 [Claviceps digitariae]